MQGIIKQLLTVCKNISPTLQEVIDGLITQAETLGLQNNVEATFTLFISFGSNYFMKHPDVFARLADLLINSVRDLTIITLEQTIVRLTGL